MRATTTEEDKKFIEYVIEKSLLEESIEWIRDNLEPEDVFGEAQLKDWAKDNGMVEEENE